MSNQLTDEQRKILEQNEKKKAQSRARSKAYYNRNSSKVLERQKKTREKKKNEVEEIRKLFAIQTIQDDNLDNIQEQNVFIEQLPSNNSNYTQNEIITLLKNDTTIKSENTRKTYISSIKRLFTMTGCENLKMCLNELSNMVSNIENSDYSVNSIKQTVQSVLYIADKYNIFSNLFSKSKASSLKKKFQTLFAKYKDKSITQLEETQKIILYPTFSDYLSRVKEVYGKSSKQYLVAFLYSQFTVRDDFKNVKIVNSLNDDNKKDNFLLIDNDNMMFIINKFKTQNKYKRLEFTVTGELKKLLNNYISNNNLNYGDTLFGKSPLTGFVSKMNQSVGYNDLKGVNIYRHMRVSELYKNKNLNFEERHSLAEQMGHSLLVQSAYKRNLKVS